MSRLLASAQCRCTTCYDSEYPHTVPFCVLGFMYNTQYAAPLAIMRLVLLVFPLPYHNYSGTAVKCPLFYELLYGTTLLVVLFQLLGIMIMDPESLSTIVPDIQRRMDPSSSVERTTTMAHTWWVLYLTLLSNLLHIVLLWHVRSTAPANWTDRKHVLYFYTQQQQQQPQQQQLHNHNNNANNNDGITNGGTTARHANGSEMTTIATIGNGESRTSNGHGSGGYTGQMSLRRNHDHNNTASTTDLLVGRMRYVPDGYDGKSLSFGVMSFTRAYIRRRPM